MEDRVPMDKIFGAALALSGWWMVACLSLCLVNEDILATYLLRPQGPNLARPTTRPAGDIQISSWTGDVFYDSDA